MACELRVRAPLRPLSPQPCAHSPQTHHQRTTNALQLGDLWDKGLPGMRPEIWSKSDPGDHGFDEWLTTQAEASNSMPNCGCFPVNHTHPGPKPPSGYADITPTGNQCVVGGGAPSDWAYPCTQYYTPNASDPRGVSDATRVPGDDSTWLVDHFETFLDKRVADKRPWLAHICFHAIHEPHPSMPVFWHQYQNDVSRARAYLSSPRAAVLRAQGTRQHPSN